MTLTPPPGSAAGLTVGCRRVVSQALDSFMAQFGPKKGPTGLEQLQQRLAAIYTGTPPDPACLPACLREGRSVTWGSDMRASCVLLCLPPSPCSLALLLTHGRLSLLMQRQTQVEREVQAPSHPREGGVPA